MRRWVLPLLATTLLATGACGGGTSPKPRTPPVGASAAAATSATDYASVDGQYRQIQIGLALPSGVTFPAHLPNTNSHYPADAGTVTAQNYWLCAWLSAYLAHEQSQQAIHHLPAYLRMDAYSKALTPQGRTVIGTVLSDVRKGNVKAVAAFTRNTCGGPFFGHAHPGH